MRTMVTILGAGGAIGSGLVKELSTRSEPIRLISRNPKLVHCMQEVWRMESPIQGAHRVGRMVSFIDVDTKTGNQTVASHAIKYYPAAADENLEDIFEQYAAEDVLILAQ
jgi:uncharacterized protein YbjT (DUF2867 family)